MAELAKAGVKAIGTVVGVACGLVFGVFAGLPGALALVIVRARGGKYFYSVDELYSLRPELLILIVGALVGAYFGWRSPTSGLRSYLRAALGAALVAAITLVAGRLAGITEDVVWTSAVIAAAVTFVIVFLFVRKRMQTDKRFVSDFVIVGILALAFAFTFFYDGDSQPPEVLGLAESLPIPDAADIREIVFVFGDGGNTDSATYPILPALAAEVDYWAQKLERDSAVSVVFPGDLVYPEGVRNREHPMFEQDSLRLWNQIELVGGENARRLSANGLFVPGNHDWGRVDGESGVQRLHNLEDQLQLGRERGYAVELVPPAGQAGPVVRDVGEDVRFVYIDSAWFLLEQSGAERSKFIDEVGRVLADEDGRDVIVVAHHPLRSAGPHAQSAPKLSNVGIEHLLNKSGALLQDLSSVRYGELVDGLRRVFAESPKVPLLFVGGHDHSLQLLEGGDHGAPAYTLVSGAGSKLSPINPVPGIDYAASRPGYAMLVFNWDGSIGVYLVAGNRDLIRCPPENRVACMALGKESFEIVHGRLIRDEWYAEVDSVAVDTFTTDIVIDSVGSSQERDLR